MSGPGRADPKVPLLLVHGTKDEVVPPALTAELLTRYCGLGATAARKLYPGADHFAVTDQAATTCEPGYSIDSPATHRTAARSRDRASDDRRHLAARPTR